MTDAHDSNIILFPKWKTSLEKQSLQALKEKKYKEALEKLNKLISYQIMDHEVIIGKLICLIELGRYKEAKDLCERLIDEPDEHYYHYLHIYLTILFQTNQYSLLMNYVEHELSMESIPETIREQFIQLYDLSSKMKQDINDEKTLSYEKKLNKAFEKDEFQIQWQLIETMRKMKTKPSDKIISSLINDQIHPMVKTSIFHWLQDANYSQVVSIHKFNKELYINPTEIKSIRQHPVFKQTLLIFNDVEQENPSFYNLLEQLLYRYIYVRYPFLPPKDSILLIAKALNVIGVSYMNLHDELDGDYEAEIQYYIDEIKLCQSLFLSIIEE